MKKLIAFCLSFVLVFSLSACQKRNTSFTSESSNYPTPSNFDDSLSDESSIDAEESSQASSSSTSHSISMSSSASVSVSTTPPSASSSTPPVSSQVSSSAAEESERQAFIQLYNLEKSAYLLSISTQINSLNAELDDWNRQASNAYVQYKQEEQTLTNRYANMGMLNSGAYQQALSTLKRNYEANNATYTSKISALQSQIDDLTAEYNNPSITNILAWITVNHNMTSEEVVAKYNKYIANT